MNDDQRNTPANWEWISLETIADINPKLPRDLGDDVEVSFIPMKRVEEETGRVDLFESRKYRDVKRGFTKFIDNDIIFAKITPCMENGKVAILQDLKNGVGFGSTEFHVIRLKDESLSRKFYFYYFLQKWFRNVAAQSFTGTVGQRRVPTGFMKEVLVPVPPSLEQFRIVGRIEELFSRLDAGFYSLQTALIQLELYRQITLKQAFTGKIPGIIKDTVVSKDELDDLRKKTHDKVIDLRKRTRKRTYGALDAVQYELLPDIPEKWIWSRLEECVFVLDYRGKTPPFSENGIPNIRSSNVKNGKIVWNNMKYITEKTYEKWMIRGFPQENDILFTTEAPLGDVAFVPKELFSIAQRVIILRAMEELIGPKFLFYQLMSPDFKDRLTGKGTGTTVTGVSYRNFRNLELVIPPISEQKQLVLKIEKIISAVENSKKYLNNSYVNIPKIKESILKEAYAGRLVPINLEEGNALTLIERIIKNDELKKKDVKMRVKRKGMGDYEMEKEYRSLSSLLLNQGGKLSPIELYKLSNLTIDQFYLHLREEVNSNKIIERRYDNVDILLEVKK